MHLTLIMLKASNGPYDTSLSVTPMAMKLERLRLPYQMMDAGWLMGHGAITEIVGS